MPSWIKSKQDTFLVALPQQNVSISTFSDMQAHAYNIIRKHSDAAFPKDPLFVIVNGVAGTGKSYLLNAIQNVLRTSCTVTAITGKAAYNINGCTIHSLLKLSSYTHPSFSCQKASRLYSGSIWLHKNYFLG